MNDGVNAGKDALIKNLSTYGYTTAPESVASCSEQTASRAAAAARNHTHSLVDRCAAPPARASCARAGASHVQQIVRTLSCVTSLNFRCTHCKPFSYASTTGAMGTNTRRCGASGAIKCAIEAQCVHMKYIPLGWFRRAG